MSMRERLGRPVSSRGFLQLVVGTVVVLDARPTVDPPANDLAAA